MRSCFVLVYILFLQGIVTQRKCSAQAKVRKNISEIAGKISPENIFSSGKHI